MAKKYLDYDGLLYFWQKIKANFVTDVTYNSTSRKIQRTKAGSTGDVVTLSKVATSNSYSDLDNKPTIPEAVQPTTTTPKMDGTASVGSETKYAKGDHVHPSDTSRVPTTRTVNGHALSSNITITASDVSAIPTSEKGSANGVCPLDTNSKVDASYLPSYVDDVIEAYARTGATALASDWLSLTSGGSALTPEKGKIYVLMADSGDYSANTQFRWSGTTYVKLADGGVTNITNGEIDTIVAS